MVRLLIEEEWFYSSILKTIFCDFVGGMSVASVFINKAIFHVYKFNHPYTLVFGQTAFTLVLLFALRQTNLIRMGNFQFHILRRV